ncbi:hypothetical protein [Synechococcus sp. MIT S1220]|uniref:hypothetical protein n=1 Tax=Synechococcus sp. MIT S1220 TaxID=3082549 RepID=UPI0039B04810
MTDTNQSHGYEEFDQQWKDCEKLWTEIIADNKFGDVETLAILQQYIHHFGVLWQSLNQHPKFAARGRRSSVSFIITPKGSQGIYFTKTNRILIPLRA